MSRVMAIVKDGAGGAESDVVGSCAFSADVQNENVVMWQGGEVDLRGENGDGEDEMRRVDV